MTQQRAVCRSCLQAGQRPIGTGSFLKIGGVLIAGLVVLFLFLVYVGG